MSIVRHINTLANKMLCRKLTFEEEIPLWYFLGICVRRIKKLIYGKMTIGVRKKGPGFMRGNRTHFYCKNKLTIGRGVSIHDYVEIDSFSENGVILGDHSSIGKRCIIKASGSISKQGKGFVLGDYSTLGNDCFVGAAGGVTVGEHCAFGQCVRFHSENHNFSRTDIPIHQQGVSNKGIEIGNDCWIGAGVVFPDGVHVGNGCVIGANSVVSRDVPDWAVVAGVPARIIKMRTTD